MTTNAPRTFNLGSCDVPPPPPPPPKRPNISDSDMAIHLYHNGNISMNVLLEMLGIDHDSVNNEIKKELVDQVRKMSRYELAKGA